MAEHFCCDSILPLLIKLGKLIQISVLISVKYKNKRCVTNIKMSRTEARAVIKYQQKKGMASKESIRTWYRHLLRSPVPMQL